MNKEKLVGMICKEQLQMLEENHPLFWNKESPHTLFYEEIIDIIDSENSGHSAEQRLNEIKDYIKSFNTKEK